MSLPRSPRRLAPCAASLVLALAACGDADLPGGGDGSAGDLHAPADAAAGPPSDAAAAADAAPPPLDLAPPPKPFVCSGKSGAPGDPVLSLVHGGLLRTSLLHVPKKYDPTVGAMLVLDFHGFISDAAQQELFARFYAHSDAAGFLVANPQGVANSWNAGQCCGTAWLNAVDDVGFVKALLGRIESDYCVDPHRVYATGLSNGGFLSYRLACEMADTLAAIAPVAGAVGVPFDKCQPSRPVPVLHFHGTADPLVPYQGGTPIVMIGIPGLLDFPSVAQTIGLWRDRDGCPGGSKIVHQKGDSLCERWSPCQGTSDVTLCTVDGGGHTWPGGFPIPFVGKTSIDLDATAMMLDFFAAHPLP